MLTKHLTKLSELSLLFTELKVNESKVEMTKLNLIDSLNSAIRQCNLNEKNIELEIKNPYSEIILLSEKKLLQSCLTIIIDNAIKYSPDNDVVKIILEKTNDSILVNVIDNGPGFSDKALENLFEFFSADNLDYRSYGFGVGLATAKIIMDIMDGEIKIANKQPNGADVKLVFKLV
jgi:K+-sensing histidine kinase KdpD